MVAKLLVQKYHLSQTEAAKKLGTTQVAISQYLSSKRAFKGVEHVVVYFPKIQEMADETACKLVNLDIDPEDVTLIFCELCSTLTIKAAILDQPNFAI